MAGRRDNGYQSQNGFYRENGFGSGQYNGNYDGGNRRNGQINGNQRPGHYENRQMGPRAGSYAGGPPNHRLQERSGEHHATRLEVSSKENRTLYKIAPTQEEANQRGGSVVMCRFNPTHILDICNIDAHQKTCKDRRRLEDYGCTFREDI